MAAISNNRGGSEDGAGDVRRTPGFEWRTRAGLWGIPLVHIAFGFDENGRIRVAKGIVAIGQFAFGGITIAQFGVGLFIGVGQVAVGLLASGQAAAGLVLAAGQFAGGLLAIGQFVVGLYGMGQTGLARYLWSPDRIDMEAVALFCTIKLKLMLLLGLG